MKWVAIVMAVLQLMVHLTETLRRRQMIKDVEASIVVGLLRGSRDALERVRKARNAPDQLGDDGLPTDKFRRRHPPEPHDRGRV